MATTTTYLVIGGGYAGVEAATQLLANKKNKVIIVDPKNYLFNVIYYPACIGSDSEAYKTDLIFPFKNIKATHKNLYYLQAWGNVEGNNVTLKHIKDEVEVSFVADGSAVTIPEGFNCECAREAFGSGIDKVIVATGITDQCKPTGVFEAEEAVQVIEELREKLASLKDKKVLVVGTGTSSVEIFGYLRGHGIKTEIVGSSSTLCAAWDGMHKKLVGQLTAGGDDLHLGYRISDVLTYDAKHTQYCFDVPDNKLKLSGPAGEKTVEDVYAVVNIYATPRANETVFKNRVQIDPQYLYDVKNKNIFYMGDASGVDAERLMVLPAQAKSIISGKAYSKFSGDVCVVGAGPIGAAKLGWTGVWGGSTSRMMSGMIYSKVIKGLRVIFD